MSLSDREVPSSVGDSYADIVTWKWDRQKMRWRAVLPDGTVITIFMERARRKTLWRYQIDDVHNYLHPSSAKFYDSAGQAEDAALAEYKERRKHHKS